MLPRAITYSIVALVVLVAFCGNLFADDSKIPMPGEKSSSSPENINEGDSVIDDMISSVSFSGYYENTITAEHLRRDNHEILLNTNRIRLNIEGRPDNQIDYGISIVGKSYNGATSVSLAKYMPDNLHDKIDPYAASTFFTYQQENDIFIQEMFGTIQLNRLRIRAGRHKFYTGTGYAYNPIDLFNRKNPLDPTYETDGIDAILISYDLPSQTQAQALMRFSDRAGTSDYLLRLKTCLNGWDVALQYTHFRKQRTDYISLGTSSASTDLRNGIRSYNQFINSSTWHLVGGEFSGEFHGIGLYGEGGHVFIKNTRGAIIKKRFTRDHERMLFGLDHTFDNQLYIMTEYLRLGQGCHGNNMITLHDRMAYYYGEILSVNRDNLFSGISYPVTDLIDASLYGIIGINDRSGYVNPWISCKLRPAVNYSCTLYIPTGNKEDATGLSGPSGFMRLKINF